MRSYGRAKQKIAKAVASLACFMGTDMQLRNANLPKPCNVENCSVQTMGTLFPS